MQKRLGTGLAISLVALVNLSSRAQADPVLNVDTVGNEVHVVGFDFTPNSSVQVQNSWHGSCEGLLGCTDIQTVSTDSQGSFSAFMVCHDPEWYVAVGSISIPFSQTCGQAGGGNYSSGDSWGGSAPPVNRRMIQFE
jgi:hypothetical protein